MSSDEELAEGQDLPRGGHRRQPHSRWGTHNRVTEPRELRMMIRISSSQHRSLSFNLVAELVR